MTDSFVFYRSYYEALQDLADAEKVILFDAICEYSLNGNLPKLNGVTSTLWKLIQPQIDSNSRKRECGKLGGRPPKETIGLQKKNHRLKKNKPNGNGNANVNDNGNDNNNNNINYDFVAQNLKEDFVSFIDFRKSIKKPLTTKDQIERLYATLKKLSGGKIEIAKEIINQSIVNGWQGLFELKESKQVYKSDKDERVDIYGKTRPTKQHALVDGKWMVL